MQSGVIYWSHVERLPGVVAGTSVGLDLSGAPAPALYLPGAIAMLRLLIPLFSGARSFIPGVM